jgi:hypothetical protein
MKAVEMICNRNCYLRTTFGSLEFEKDVSRLVAPQMVEAALAIGILPVDQEQVLFEEDPDDPEPLDPGSRNAAITRAINTIIERNDPDDFTTGDAPKTKAVAKEAGLAKVGAHEIKTVLAKRNKIAYEATLANKKEQAKKAQLAKAAKADPPDDEC